MSGCAFWKAVTAGSRAASTQTVMALFFTWSAVVKPYGLLVEAPPVEPEQPANMSRPAVAAATTVSTRLAGRRADDGCDISHPYLSASLTTDVGRLLLHHTYDVL